MGASVLGGEVGATVEGAEVEGAEVEGVDVDGVELVATGDSEGVLIGAGETAIGFLCTEAVFTKPESSDSSCGSVSSGPSGTIASRVILLTGGSSVASTSMSVDDVEFDWDTDGELVRVDVFVLVG